jgi:hypothetical protein
VERRKILLLPGLKLQPLYSTARSYTDYFIPASSEFRMVQKVSAAGIKATDSQPHRVRADGNNLALYADSYLCDTKESYDNTHIRATTVRRPAEVRGLFVVKIASEGPQLGTLY